MTRAQYENLLARLPLAGLAYKLTDTGGMHEISVWLTNSPAVRFLLCDGDPPLRIDPALLEGQDAAQWADACEATAKVFERCLRAAGVVPMASEGQAPTVKVRPSRYVPTKRT